MWYWKEDPTYKCHWSTMLMENWNRSMFQWHSLPVVRTWRYPLCLRVQILQARWHVQLNIWQGIHVYLKFQIWQFALTDWCMVDSAVKLKPVYDRKPHTEAGYPHRGKLPKSSWSNNSICYIHGISLILTSLYPGCTQKRIYLNNLNCTTSGQSMDIRSKHGHQVHVTQV